MFEISLGLCTPKSITVHFRQSQFKI